MGKAAPEVVTFLKTAEKQIAAAQKMLEAAEKTIKLDQEQRMTVADSFDARAIAGNTLKVARKLKIDTAGDCVSAAQKIEDAANKAFEIEHKKIQKAIKQFDKDDQKVVAATMKTCLTAIEKMADQIHNAGARAAKA